MSPLDRINQFANENTILRSQLRDAQEQAKRDSSTIARLGKEHEAAASGYRGQIKCLIVEKRILEQDLLKCTP